MTARWLIEWTPTMPLPYGAPKRWDPLAALLASPLGADLDRRQVEIVAGEALGTLLLGQPGGPAAYPVEPVHGFRVSLAVDGLIEVSEASSGRSLRGEFLSLSPRMALYLALVRGLREAIGVRALGPFKVDASVLARARDALGPRVESFVAAMI